MAERTLIIAEAGVNHNGNPTLALELVDAAADAGADVVKFQTFRAEAVASPVAPKAEYQTRTTGAGESQLEMLRQLELSRDAHRAVVDRCRTRNIRFLSTPCELDSLDFLVRGLKVDALKIGSGDMTNAPLLLEAARSGLPVILSTGMATMEEIEAVLGILALGYDPDGLLRPSQSAFRKAFATSAGQAALKAKVTLLHCTTEYPADERDANLGAMETMRRAFDLPVGFSDHTLGTAVAIGAVALGATVIEKHLTLDHSLPGPDHAASLLPDQFGALVTAIRAVEAAVGDGVKRPRPVEMKTIPIARKSLVAGCTIAKGDVFTPDNLRTLRPGSGISALEYFDWLDHVAGRDYAAGDLIVP